MLRLVFLFAQFFTESEANTLSTRNKGTRNKDIRDAIKTAGLYQYQVADTLGIDETKLSKMLRYDLSKTDRESILNAVAMTKINQQAEREAE